MLAGKGPRYATRVIGGKTGLGAARLEGENFVRGQGFHSLMFATKTLLGEAAHDKVVASLSGPLGEAWRYGSLVRSGWFPVGWYADLHRNIARVNTQVKAAELHKRLGAVSCEHDIRGIYRFMLGFSSPRFALHHIDRIFGTFIKTSRLEIVSEEPQRYHLLLTIPGLTPEIWEDISGGAEVVLAASGAKGVHVQITPRPSLGVGDFRANWDEPDG